MVTATTMIIKEERGDVCGSEMEDCGHVNSCAHNEKERMVPCKDEKDQVQVVDSGGCQE